MTFVTVKPENGRVSFPKLADWIDSVLDRPEFPNFSNFETFKTPALVNTVETKDTYEIELVAPGFEKEQIKVSVEENILTLTAEREERKLDEGDKYTRREYNFNSFKRHFTLPKTVDAAKITAEYKNGVLHVSIPKVEEARVKPTLEIKVA